MTQQLIVPEEAPDAPEVGERASPCHLKQLADLPPAQRAAKAMGLFAHVPGGAEAFAQEKQTEIAREEGLTDFKLLP